MPEVPVPSDPNIGINLRLTIQAYGSAHGRRRSAPALPVLRFAHAIQALGAQGQGSFRFRQLRLQLVRRRAQRFAARGSVGARLASSGARLDHLFI